MKTTSTAAALAGLFFGVVLAAPAPQSGCRTVHPPTATSPAVLDCGQGLVWSSESEPPPTSTGDRPGPGCTLKDTDDYTAKTGCYCYNCQHDDDVACFYYDTVQWYFGWEECSKWDKIDKRSHIPKDVLDDMSKLHQDVRAPQITSAPNVPAAHQHLRKSEFPPAKIALSDLASLVSRIPPQPISSTWVKRDGIDDELSSGVSKVTSAGKEVPTAASKVSSAIGDIFTRM